MGKQHIQNFKRDLIRSQHFLRFKDEFDKQIESEMMHSEVLRARFLSVVFLTLALISILITLMGHDMLAIAGLSKLNLPAIWLVLLLYAGYEFAFSRAILLFRKKSRKFPFPAKYFNAFLEISLPSLALFILLGQFPQELALSTPPALLYFLFIILASLRLEPVIAIYTGAVAAIEFFILAIWSQQANPAGLSVPPGIESAIFPAIAGTKSFILLAAGLIAGFVTGEIRKRIVSTIKTLDEHERLRSIFGQQVSPAVMERLLHQGGEADSESRPVCIMFLDIRNFTNFSENRPPEELVQYLNRLWDFMIEIINRHHGIINKFLGDGFMAVFGAPLPDAEANLNAVRAALEISDRLRREISDGSLEPTTIGIGLHAGLAVTGNVGSRDRREYTIIGDVVNLASRIEQLNKQHSSEILVSGEVWHSLKDQLAQNLELAQTLSQCQNLGMSAVKGRDQGVELWRIR